VAPAPAQQEREQRRDDERDGSQHRRQPQRGKPLPALGSSMCDMESVSVERLCLASSSPMSGTNGSLRENHNPANSATLPVTPMMARPNGMPGG
jgi:hypothetical protein